jgi:hypothetical protein
MAKLDRQLNNRGLPRTTKTPIVKPRRKCPPTILVDYRNGKYILIDLETKKGGHSQRYGM